MLRFFPLLATASLAFAQQYSITTIAGGAPPATPAPAANISIGQPRRVAVDSGGNVYFSSGNSVFKLSTSGTLSLAAGNSRPGYSGDNGAAVTAQLNAPQGLAFDSAGNLYIADSGNNRIRIVSPGGIINTFAGNGKTSLGGGPGQYNDGGPATNGLLRLPMAVAVDTAGNVYIADTGDNSIRKVTRDGIINTIVGDSYPGFFGDGGNATAAEVHTPSDIALDSKGNLYIADTANAVIRQVTSAGVISTFAGTTAIGFAGDGDVATKAALLAPISVAVDGSGNVYVAENGDGRIRKIDTKGNINTIVGNGTNGFAGDGSDPAKAQLNFPTGVTVDGSGNLYIADFSNLRVRKVPSSGSISTVAGNGVLSYSGDGGQALAAQLNNPLGVAVDNSGNVFVSDSGNNVIRRITKAGVIATVAGNGAAGNGGDGSAATSGQLSSPSGLAVDSSGNLYIADTQNAKVRRVTSAGVISTVAGNGTPGFGGDGAGATSAQLNSPSGVAVDLAGNVYFADFSNNRVRKVAPTGTITTIAGNGGAGYTGDGGLATNARLNLPVGVAVDASGNVYIADSGNNVVRMVNAGGIISTIAGTGAAGYTGDGGLASKAQLVNPRAIAVDGIGNVYIADGGTVIRKITYPTGIIQTIGGNGTSGYAGDGGLATSGSINGPQGIALDSTGNVYIADTNNNAVRALTFAGSAVSISAITNAASNATGGLAPGELIVIYGSNLGPAKLVQFQLNTNGLVPTSLAGTSVIINGILAPIIYTSATQVAAVVPFEVRQGPGSGGVSCAGAPSIVPVACVIYNGQVSATVEIGLSDQAPGIFTANASGSGPAAALTVSKGTTSVNDSSHPANAGDIVTLYITGAGQTNPAGINGKPGGDGSNGNPIALPQQTVIATIGGKAATVQFAGGAPGVVAGVLQVNVVVPAGLPAGPASVTLFVGSTPAQSGTTIFVSGN